MNVQESNDTVTLLRVLQGLHKPAGGPYTPDEVVAASQRLGERAGKALLLTVPVSRSAVVQTLDHLAELDDEADE